MSVFEEVLVWRKLADETAIRYFCFKNISSKLYAIQHADFFRLPIDDGQIRQFARQSIELFIEESPLERCEWYNSLEEAIAAHHKTFN